jgi:hypothetical protein
METGTLRREKCEERRMSAEQEQESRGREGV